MKAFSMFLAMLGAIAVPSVSAQDKPALRATPNLGEDIEKVVFDELWERPGLNKRDRSLVTLVATVAQGRTSTLPFYFTLALEHGVQPQELAGAITHLAYYSGLAAAVEAAPALATVLAERDIDLSSLRVAEPKSGSDKEALQAQRNVVNAMVGDVSPGLAHFSNEFLNGDLWLRDDLSPRDRSLVTISALITQGNTEQLSAHVPKGLGNGLTHAELGEIITQLAFYAGWPRAFSAATAIKAMALPTK